MITRLDHRWVLTLTLATALCVLLLAALFVTLQTAPTTSLPDANAKVASMSEHDGSVGANFSDDSNLRGCADRRVANVSIGDREPI
jgi:hypothetical protein